MKEFSRILGIYRVASGPRLFAVYTCGTPMAGPRRPDIACAAALELQLIPDVRSSLADVIRGVAYICNQALRAFVALSRVPKEIPL